MASLHPVRKVDKAIELIKPRSVLDIGCGTGNTTTYYSNLALKRLALRHRG